MSRDDDSLAVTRVRIEYADGTTKEATGDDAEAFADYVDKLVAARGLYMPANPDIEWEWEWPDDACASESGE